MRDTRGMSLKILIPGLHSEGSASVGQGFSGVADFSTLGVGPQTRRPLGAILTLNDLPVILAEA